MGLSWFPGMVSAGRNWSSGWMSHIFAKVFLRVFSPQIFFFLTYWSRAGVPIWDITLLPTFGTEKQDYQSFCKKAIRLDLECLVNQDCHRVLGLFCNRTTVVVLPGNCGDGVVSPEPRGSVYLLLNRKEWCDWFLSS